MEVYVDDMITKSKNPNEHIEHLEETFELLRKYKMKFNSKKCAFGVEAGKFLGESRRILRKFRQSCI